MKMHVSLPSHMMTPQFNLLEAFAHEKLLYFLNVSEREVIGFVITPAESTEEKRGDLTITQWCLDCEVVIAAEHGTTETRVVRFATTLGKRGGKDVFRTTSLRSVPQNTSQDILTKENVETYQKDIQNSRECP